MIALKGVNRKESFGFPPHMQWPRIHMGHHQSVPAPYQHLHTRCLLRCTCKRHHTIPGNEHKLLLVTGREQRWMVVIGTGIDANTVTWDIGTKIINPSYTQLKLD